MLTRGQAPDFDLRSAEPGGRPAQLSLITPLWPALLIFFRSDCDACREMLPRLAEFSRGFEGADLEVIGVSQDSGREARAYAERIGWKARIVVDPRPHAVSAAYGITELPAVVLVGTDGNIAVAAEGVGAGRYNNVSRAVARLTGWPYRLIVPEEPPETDPCPSRSTE